MKSMKVEYNQKCYRYIFPLMNIFSRFHWLVPLTRKKSSQVKKELQQIYKGQVKDYCKSKKIKMINCHLYSPKAQGKVGCSHCSLRQKIYYDLIQQEKKSVNWVKSLPDYMKCLNNEKKEELGWKSPFEICYGRKSNELLHDGKSVTISTLTLLATNYPHMHVKTCT